MRNGSNPTLFLGREVVSCSPEIFEACNAPFLEKVGRIIRAFQTANFLALFFGETISMPEYKMFPYHICPGPFDTANEASAWDLMLVPYMPSNLLASSIAFAATIIMAAPLRESACQWHESQSL
jgi:hypothetical protein